MLDDMYEGGETMDISRDSDDCLEDELFLADQHHDTDVADMRPDHNGQAWREIEKYRERKALEAFIKDDLYDDLDIRSILD